MSVLVEHRLTLVIGGKGYLGWTGIEVERAIDAATGSFQLDLVSREKTGAADWPIDEGASCSIVLGNETLITGYIDKVNRRISSEQRSITVTGRDKALDLVDCSAVHAPGSWSNQKLETIAQQLANPFGISIEITGDTGAAFKRFALQQGETVFAAIERMTRYRGLVVYSAGDGKLRIGNADSGQRAGKLIEGVNIKEADATRDVSERFSQYIVKGQASGDDHRHGKTVAQVKGTASDSEVARYRPLIVVAEEQSDTASLTKRAKWEASVRSGRGKPLVVTTPGWLTDEGKVWQPGARSACDIPSCKVSGDLLIESVRMRSNDSDGTLTELSLVPPEAWTQLAEKEEG